MFLLTFKLQIKLIRKMQNLKHNHHWLEVVNIMKLTNLNQYDLVIKGLMKLLCLLLCGKSNPVLPRQKQQVLYNHQPHF